MNNYPDFPLYIPSKGRSEYMITSKYLTEMGVKHHIIVEPDECEAYEEAIQKNNLLSEVVELDLKFKDNYDTCDTLGLSKSVGPGAARNFAWEHSIKNGHEWHWVMDDNINGFFRFNKNLKVPCKAPAFWKAMEDFCLRYKNVAMGGPQYQMFAPRKGKHPPFVINTRIYSCNLIRNDVPLRWRGRYNEDTILSIDMLKAGYCTIQFNAFLQKKMQTQMLKGGNTDDFYHKEGQAEDGQKYTKLGTLAKSQMQVMVHPDISKIVYRFNRIHHHVDYSGFKRMKLVKRDDLIIDKNTNNFGMELKKVESNNA